MDLVAIDMHCHLARYPDPVAIITECERRKIGALAVSTTPDEWTSLKRLATGREGIRVALGLHPELVGSPKADLEQVGNAIRNVRYVGEIGLDGSRPYASTMAEQISAFRTILAACARCGGKVLSIHSRQAAEVVLAVVEEILPRDDRRVILHWFSGSKQQALRAAANGLFFSVNPAMMSSKRARDLIACLPRERILTETDGPYTTVSGRPAMPWDVQHVLDGLSLLWGLPHGSAGPVVSDNLRRLLS